MRSCKPAAGADARSPQDYAVHTNMHDAYQVKRRISHGVRTSMRFAYKYAWVHTRRSDLVCDMHTLGIRFAYKYASCIPRRSDLVCMMHIEICVLHTSMHGCIFSPRLCNTRFRSSGFSACRKSQLKQLCCCTALTCNGNWNFRGGGRRVVPPPRERRRRRRASVPHRQTRARDARRAARGYPRASLAFHDFRGAQGRSKASSAARRTKAAPRPPAGFVGPL